MSPLFYGLLSNTAYADLFGIKPPKPNRKNNVKALLRFLSAFLPLLRASLLYIPSHGYNALVKFSKQLVELYDANPHRFCSLLKETETWFRCFFATGMRPNELLGTDNYNAQHDCPELIVGLFLIFESLKRDRQRTYFGLLILTILSSFRTVIVPKALNSDSITTPGTCPEFNEELIPDALCALGITRDTFMAEFNSRVRANKRHFTSSSGPNGPALQNASWDAKAILNDPKLRKFLHDWCQLTGQQSIWKAAVSANIYCRNMFGFDEPVKVADKVVYHSKLHVIYEKGDKSRIIAMADYWTQDALTPLHDTLFHFLGKIDNDFTMNQEKGFNFVKDTLCQGNFDQVASLDLSAATDRLPVWYQAKILSHLFNSDKIGQAWRDLISNRSFYLEKENKYIRYACGQPMGLKSSFAMLGLMHHVVVQIAAMKAGMGARSFSDYAILGDDIVLAHGSVIMEYRNYMDYIGQDISDLKSLFSRSTPHSAEFCKRLIVEGQEASPFPAGLLVQVGKSGKFAPQLQAVMIMRNLVINPQFFWNYMDNLLTTKHLNNLATMNGMPGAVSGLKETFPLSSYPNTLADMVAMINGLEVDDWINVSTYHRMVSAARALAHCISSLDYNTYRDEGTNWMDILRGTPHNPFLPLPDRRVIFTDKARKLGLDAPSDRPFSVVYQDRPNPYFANDQGRIDLFPMAVGLKESVNLHPTFALLFEYTEYVREYLNDLAYGVEKREREGPLLFHNDSANFIDFALRMRFLQTKSIENLTRQISEDTKGIRSNAHMEAVINTLSGWIHDPDGTRQHTSTIVTLPILRLPIAISVAPGQKASMTLGSRVPNGWSLDTDLLSFAKNLMYVGQPTPRVLLRR
jgi:hypothetical protein